MATVVFIYNTKIYMLNFGCAYVSFLSPDTHFLLVYMLMFMDWGVHICQDVQDKKFAVI